MFKYIYPAVFTPEGNGRYSAEFPDFEGCCTHGYSLEGVVEMAADILSVAVKNAIENGEDLPEPMPVKDIEIAKGEFVLHVGCD